MTEHLVLQRSGDIAWLILNRPEKRNAISFEMWLRIPELIEEVEQDESVKVLIVRGADERAFSAGADISEFQDLRSTPDGARRYNDATEGAALRLAALRKPTIAMVRGLCIGGGCGLALACDLRFADTTSRFGITPAKLGLVYSLNATKDLVDLVGPAQAKQILFSGRHVAAERAGQIGLVDELLPPEELEAFTLEFAAEVASRAQFSVRSAKRMVQLITGGQAEDSDESLALRLDSFETEDYREGVVAFLEKRQPNFSYR